MGFQFDHGYEIDKSYSSRVAYVCMEFGIDQSLKTYAGGLGFLAGSFMRSAYELKQNVIGIGILWKYGYYNQGRKQDLTMSVLFEEKNYGFLIPTGIKFSLKITKHDVWVSAFYLPPEVFKTAPLFLLSTDLPENDYLAKTITHKLYDANPETSIAASIILGEGSAKLLEELKWQPDLFHLNESHALPLAFYLYQKYKNINEVKSKIVYTNHTPEEAGNLKTNIALLEKMSYFCDVPISEIIAIAKIEQDKLDHTETCLNLSRKSNAVSLLHKNTLIKNCKNKDNLCNIISITNAQNYNYWHDEELFKNIKDKPIENISIRKESLKSVLFEIVADQCGEIYDPKVCTIVFAKRFAGYKRADIFFHNMERFEKLVTNKEKPVQIIWAGKPYPMDYNGIGVYDKIVDICKKYGNCSILTGYEMKLSKVLKGGADVWLNMPRLFHEASGTSGMAAAMNGAVNVGIPDGWFPEFAKDKKNAFVIPSSDTNLPEHIQDDLDCESLYDVIEKEILPIYYDYPNRWFEIIRSAALDIIPYFDSNRMNKEYYDKLYNSNSNE